MRSWEAAELLGVSATATPLVVHAAWRQVSAVDRNAPDYPQRLESLRAARAILLSRAKNAREDAQAGRGKKWWERERPRRAEPAPRALSRLTWPGVGYIRSEFFAARGLELRPVDGNSIAVVDRKTRDVVATLARHPARPAWYCFRQLDHSYGACDGVQYFRVVCDSLEPASEGASV